MKIKYLPIIINPAAGKPQPVLFILNQVFQDSGIEWDSLIAKDKGDEHRFTDELIKKKVEAIGVFGGDGTVMKVMERLAGTDVLLVIFPGGTGNVLATDLGIPKDLEQACAMIRDANFEARTIDMGQVQRRYFVIRACLGFEADMVKGADRETKNRWGRFAYVLGAFRAMRKMKLVNYEITVDGEIKKVQGLTCIVANSGNVGFGDITIAKEIDIEDGLLDVLVIKKMNLSIVKYLYRVMTRGRPEEDREVVGHWQGKDIKVTSHPAQDLVLDGEVFNKTVLHAKAVPCAVNVGVPKKARQNARFKRENEAAA